MDISSIPTTIHSSLNLSLLRRSLEEFVYIVERNLKLMALATNHGNNDPILVAANTAATQVTVGDVTAGHVEQQVVTVKSTAETVNLPIGRYNRTNFTSDRPASTSHQGNCVSSSTSNGSPGL